MVAHAPLVGGNGVAAVGVVDTGVDYTCGCCIHVPGKVQIKLVCVCVCVCVCECVSVCVRVCVAERGSHMSL